MKRPPITVAPWVMLLLLASGTVAGAAPPVLTERFAVYREDVEIGRLVAEVDGAQVKIEFDVKDNGRGPTVAESVTLDAGGLPSSWRITGTQTFGGKIDESFRRRGNTSSWRDSGGPGSAQGEPKLYIAQSASPWALQLYAREILDAGGRLDVLPAGTLALTKGERLTLQGKDGELAVTRYDLTGLDLSPTIMLLDDERRLIALPGASGGMVRAGFEGENARLRKLVTEWQAARWADIQRESAKRFDGPVRITNVRIFDPATRQLTAPVSVVVSGRLISGVHPVDSPATPGETVIDGAGGTLVPGMFEMHGHLGESGALLNVLAGVTSVRDMGNTNGVLEALERRIVSGEVAGPRIVRSGFIEGKSPFSANNGVVTDSEARALEAVRWYAARGFPSIKIYNSINPAWVPAMVAEARRLGMKVMGHVPAFTSADAMIAAGYDEITHINQLALGWIIKPGEDTRTLFRLTALGRLEGLDLDSAPVQSTLDTMRLRGIALDPTLGIHENLLLNRNGTIAPGAADYYANMPIGVQRDLRQAWSNPDTFGGDATARVAFDKLVDLLRRAHAKGIFIVPGTDTGGSFTYHRELELMTRAGFSPAEALARATLDMARYLGMEQTTGSIERGKFADFFLIPGDPTRDIKAIKTITLVAKDGVFYLPGEVYPRLGIKPFAAPPRISAAAATTSAPQTSAPPPMPTATGDGERLIAEFGLREATTPVAAQPGWRAPKKILVDTGLPGLIDALRTAAPGVQFVGADSPAAAAQLVEGADAVIGRTAFICDGRVLAAGRDLRWLQSVYAGVEACGKQAATLQQRRILLSNLRAVSAPVIAEHVIAFTLTLSRSMQAWIPLQQQRVWADESDVPPMSVIAGKTMLVVGLGGIGSEVAKRAHALGMRVIATRATPQAKPEYIDYVGASSELGTLIAQADFVVNALPLTPATSGMFDAAMFARMKRSAFFINVGRGQTVVTADLTAALRDRLIAGAGLDVVEPEPLPADDPLWRQPNLVLTPHVSGGSDLGPGATVRVLRENLRRYVAGERLLSLVDVARGY